LNVTAFDIIFASAGLTYIVSTMFIIINGPDPDQQVRDSIESIIDRLNISVMIGFITLGVLAYVIVPSLTTNVEIIASYSPHAYNLILWPILGLTILRRMFKPRYFLLTFAFIYGLDELLWNVLAVARFWGQWSTTLAYISSPYWGEFFLVMCVFVIIGFIILRPKIELNVTWIILGGFAFFWAWIAGMPTIAVANVTELSFDSIVYRVAWELMWQFAFWVFVCASVKPNGQTSKTH
jgi:hypothetical protein